MQSLSCVRGLEGSLTCGVSMCTYNGMPYLEQQLRSLLAQQRVPDQLVIFDDSSNDGTWEFLQSWAAGVSIPVTLHQNTIRQGVVTNFEAAVGALKTDLIFLCDQDDVWLPNKIDLMAKVFESDPNVLLVHTDAQLVDADAHDLGISLFKALSLSRQDRDHVQAGDAFLVLCGRNLVTGATAAFRQGLLEIALPFPPCWLHDEWLAILAAATGRVVLLDVQTIQYRQHARNVVGMPVPGLLRNLQRLVDLLGLPTGAFQAKRVVRTIALLERLQMQPELPQGYLNVMRDALAHARFRSLLPRNPVRRVWAVLRESRTGSYRRFSSGFRGMLRDMLNR